MFVALEMCPHLHDTIGNIRKISAFYLPLYYKTGDGTTLYFDYEGKRTTL